MSFFAELRRRNVFKVGAAYAVVAWLLLQITDVVLPTFDAPQWVAQTITFLLAIGFPIAVVLAWAFEVTTDGVKRTKQIPLENSISHVTGQKLNYFVTAFLAVAVVFMATDDYLLSNRSGGADSSPDGAEAVLTGAAETSPESMSTDAGPELMANGIAILPFENMSIDPDDAFFAAGIHDEIINQVAQIQDLTVIARTSVLQYDGARRPITEIARELGVANILEGSVSHADNRVRIRAQLIDGASGGHVWSEVFQGETRDVFSIYADISERIARSLEAELLPAERERIATPTTDSSAAWALYLRARLSLNSYSDAAIADLDRAIELDPDFALAYGQKALALVARGRVDPDLEADRARQARGAAERALELQPDLASAHATLAALHAANWNWADAEAAYARALESNPNDTFVLEAYGSFKRDIGEHEQSVRLLERRIELDPYASGNQLGISYRYAKNYDAAADFFRNSINRNPSANNHAHLAFTEINRGNTREAVELLETAEQLWGEGITARRLGQLALAYGYLDRPQQVERLVSRIRDIGDADPTSVRGDVWTNVALAQREYDRALEQLELVLDGDEAGYMQLGQIKANDYNDPVLEESRWRELRDRINAF